MAKISKTRKDSADGDVEYCVQWTENDGVVRERYFASRRAAERFGTEIELQLLNETIADFNTMVAAMTPQQVRKFNRSLKVR